MTTPSPNDSRPDTKPSSQPSSTDRAHPHNLMVVDKAREPIGKESASERVPEERSGPGRTPSSTQGSQPQASSQKFKDSFRAYRQLESENSALEDSERPAHSRIRKLETALHDSQEDFASLRSQNSVLQDSERQAHSRIRKLETALHDAQEGYASLRSQNSVLQDSERQAHSRIRNLETALHDAQEDYASLRSHLQSPETLGLQQVISQFRGINRAVSDICVNISENLVLTDPIAGKDGPLTSVTHLGSLINLEDCIPQGHTIPSSHMFKDHLGLPLADLFDYGLPSIINEALYQHIFMPFHPALPPSDMLGAVYQHTRRQEPQTISSKWRTCTLLALESEFGPRFREQLIETVFGAIRDRFEKLVDRVHLGQTRPRVISAEMERRLRQIIGDAYNWNQLVKSQVSLLDYHPRLVPNDAAFDPETMESLGRLKHGRRPTQLVFAVTLGLISSEAQGGGKEPVRFIQERTKVLTMEYFNQ